MKCPNGCGELVEFENLKIEPTGDCEDLIDEYEHQGGKENDALNNIPEKKYWFWKITKACPKCGYHEATELTEEQYAKTSLTIVPDQSEKEGKK